MKKGFIFSLDAIIAVLIALFMITSIIFYISQNSHSKNRENLNNIALDSLVLLEKNGALSATAISLDPSALDSYLGTLPDNICAKIDLFESQAGGGLHKTISHYRAGCPSSASYIISRRVFIASGSTYLAELEVWHR
jgi:hypothetical protein